MIVKLHDTYHYYVAGGLVCLAWVFFVFFGLEAAVWYFG